MADGINFSVDEVMRSLDLTEAKVNRGVNEVLKESAEPLKAGIEDLTNVSDGTTHRSGEGHAKYDVIVANVKGGQSDEKSVDVGYQKTAWRMYFVVLGTSYQKPQNIIQRSITAKKGEVKEKQIAGLRRLLGT